MGKKRKASRSSEPTGSREADPADARLHVTSYKDVADSEEEYFIDKDKILLEDEPRAKRLRSEKEDDILESSDEEVLGFDHEDDETDNDDENDDGEGEVDAGDEDEEVDGDHDGIEDDRGYWGSLKKEYYEADALETEADALAEEAEAKRLQQKRLSRMSEADFVFDVEEWAVTKAEGPDGDEVVTEVLEAAEIAPGTSPEEVYRILQASYPEFDFLVNEFRELQPKLAVCQQEAEGKPSKSLEVVRFWTLGCYVAALASYFAILTSPVRDGGEGHQKALDPAKLREHEVMETLVSCRQAWSRVNGLRNRNKGARATSPESLSSPAIARQTEALERGAKPEKFAVRALPGGQEASAKKQKQKQKLNQQLAKAKKLEASLADLSDLVAKAREKTKGKSKEDNKIAAAQDDNSDFGDEDALDSRTAEDKATRKKSLRFYTSQIVQKAGRRAGAGREAGGDMDIPHRERLRDRQARLNGKAARRGQNGAGPGEELGGESDDDDAAQASGVRDEEDEYYDIVAHASRQKKVDKAARNEALKAAGRLDRVVEVEQVGEDGKRQVSYTILKNKGLTPKRKKEVRNPRVKKRKKFEERRKKLKSIRAVYSGGEGRGGYQGELSGIKTGLIKSVKL